MFVLVLVCDAVNCKMSSVGQWRIRRGEMNTYVWVGASPRVVSKVSVEGQQNRLRVNRALSPLSYCAQHMLWPVISTGY